MFLYHFRVYKAILFILTELVPTILRWIEKCLCFVKNGVCYELFLQRKMALLHEGQGVGAVWGQTKPQVQWVVPHMCPVSIWWRDKCSVSCCGVSPVPSCLVPGDSISTWPEWGPQKVPCLRNRAAKWPWSPPRGARS